jgi:hypothetical protein
MQVDLSTCCVSDDEPHGAPADGLDESGVCKGRHDGWFLVVPVHQIQVTVLAGLLADQGVDAPAAADPGVDVRVSQHREDGQYVVSRHHDGQR